MALAAVLAGAAHAQVSGTAPEAKDMTQIGFDELDGSREAGARRAHRYRRRHAQELVGVRQRHCVSGVGRARMANAADDAGVRLERSREAALHVEVDERGYIYAVDRANSGLVILELTGDARRVANFPH